MTDNKKEIDYLKILRKSLLASNKFDIEMNLSWSKNFPDAAGVYIFFEDNSIVYVGETRSLRRRMRNILRTNNHTLRRKIRNHYFSDKKDRIIITSASKLNLNTEKLINDWLENRMKMSYLPVALGRKELEELILHDYGPRYNSINKNCY